jgi:PST family polysaccharide transporter
VSTSEERDHDRDQLRGNVAAGVRWTTVSLFGVQGARIVFSLVLASLLGPTNFGIVGQATIYIALTSIFLDLGFGVTIIQRERLTKEDIGTVSWLNAATAVAVSASTIALAPAIAQFFGTPELTAVLRVLALTVLLKGLTVIPRALLTRQMRFQALSIVEVSATIAGGVAGIASAYRGAGYWALVIQTVVTDLLYVIGVRAVERGGSWRFSRRAVRELGTYSATVMGSQLLWYAKDNSDNLLIAKYLGPSALANYSIGYRVMMVPIQTFSQVVVRVMLPTFARLRRAPDELAGYFLKATQAISMMTFPLMAGVVLATPMGIPWLIGEEWEPSVVPMQLLAVTAAHQSVLSLGGPALMATGRAAWLLRFSLFSTVVSVGAFIIGLRWGINGVAGAFTLAGLALAPIFVTILSKIMPITFARWLRAILPALTGCLTMSVAFLGLRELLVPLVATPAVLGGCIAFAATTYAATIWFGFPSQRADTVGMLLTVLRDRTRRESDPPDATPAEPPSTPEVSPT